MWHNVSNTILPRNDQLSLSISGISSKFQDGSSFCGYQTNIRPYFSCDFHIFVDTFDGTEVMCKKGMEIFVKG